MPHSSSNFENDDEDSSYEHGGDFSDSETDETPDHGAASDASILWRNPILPSSIFDSWRKAMMPFQDLYKNMMDEIVAPHAATVEAMRQAVKPSQELYKNMMDEIVAPHAATVEAMRQAVKPSTIFYRNMMDQIMPPRLMDTLLDLETTLSTTQNNILQTLSAQYLRDIGNEAAASTDESDVIDDEELQEQFGEIGEPWSDPVHTVFIESAARAGIWLQEKYPTLERNTIQIVSEYVTLFLYSFIPQLTFYLGTAYGVEGLVAASAIAAGIGIISERDKRVLDREIGLGRQCGFCGAKPGDPCVTKSGKAPGTLAKNMHKPRWQ